MKERFREFSEQIACWAGTYWAFLIALCVVAMWAVTGPIFDYSDTWQLVINTGTTIVTFLMVFLIQNTQNRESRVTALKLDELLRALEGARTGFVNLEHMTDDELESIRGEFERLRGKYTPLAGHLVHIEREIASRRN
jgi:low affinity Fe/Cu permease